MNQFVMRMYAALQSGLFTLRDGLADRERGATAVEYGLLVALIAAVIVVVVAALGLQVNAAFQTVSDALP